MKFWHDSHITISTMLEKLKRKYVNMFNFFNEDIEDNDNWNFPHMAMKFNKNVILLKRAQWMLLVRAFETLLASVYCSWT